MNSLFGEISPAQRGGLVGAQLNSFYLHLFFTGSDSRRQRTEKSGDILTGSGGLIK